MQKRILWQVAILCLSFNLSSQYIYEGNQSLVDLTNESNTTNLNSGDDQLSSAFNLDFTFTFYDKQFTSARMATNGCLHFGLGETQQFQEPKHVIHLIYHKVFYLSNSLQR